jgi:hypothetical protein
MKKAFGDEWGNYFSLFSFCKVYQTTYCNIYIAVKLLAFGMRTKRKTATESRFYAPKNLTTKTKTIQIPVENRTVSIETTGNGRSYPRCTSPQ